MHSGQDECAELLCPRGLTQAPGSMWDQAFPTNSSKLLGIMSLLRKGKGRVCMGPKGSKGSRDYPQPCQAWPGPWN